MAKQIPAARPEGGLLLQSLAVLNVNWEIGRKSYYDNFVPFALEAMRRHHQTDYSSHEVAEYLVAEFGLSIPDQVVDSILSRASRVKILRRDNSRYHFDLKHDDSRSAGIQRTQARVAQEHKEFVARLIEFAQTRYEVVWDERAAEEALLNHVERHAVPLLASAVEGRKFDPRVAEERDSDYIVSAFTVMLVDEGNGGFGHIEALVKGCMLSAALYVPNSGETTRKFKHTTLYLDTPVCLKALGHEGDEARVATLQTLLLAKQQGAKLACFEHTRREMEGVLHSARSSLTQTGTESGSRGVRDHFRKAGHTTSDVDGFIANLERDLSRISIEVHDTPPHEARWTVDESALEDLMQERVDYWRPKARENDLNSLTAVFRLRKGRASSYLEECTAVLITDNNSLVGAARTYFRDETNGWPISMPEHELAALIWIKAPTAAPDLPRHQIIADCYSALAPSQAHWERIVGEAERLAQRGQIDAEELALIKHSREAQRCIMDVTFGNSARVDTEALKTALARTKDEIRRPAVDEKDQAERRAAQAVEGEGVARFERERTDSENSELKAQIAKLTDAEAKRDTRIRARAERNARWYVRGPAWTTAAMLLAVAALNQTAPKWTGHLPGWLSAVAGILGIVVILLSNSRLVIKKNFLEWLERPEIWLAARLDRRYRVHAGLAPDRE